MPDDALDYFCAGCFELSAVLVKENLQVGSQRYLYLEALLLTNSPAAQSYHVVNLEGEEIKRLSSTTMALDKALEIISVYFDKYAVH